LLDLLDDRYRIHSAMLISQVPVPQWHAQIQDPTIADALLDRIIHDAIRLNLKGESMRKLTSPLPKPDIDTTQQP
jgi:DNA replication protein DnaC